jgi:hypothetical protein
VSVDPSFLDEDLIMRAVSQLGFSEKYRSEPVDELEIQNRRTAGIHKALSDLGYQRNRRRNGDQTLLRRKRRMRRNLGYIHTPKSTQSAYVKIPATKSPAGPPELQTEKRAKARASLNPSEVLTITPKTRPISREDLQAIIHRLSLRKKSLVLPTGNPAPEYTRQAPLRTVEKRSFSAQSEYMTKLASRNSSLQYTENFIVSDCPRYATYSEQLRTTLRLSQPRTLKSLIEKYSEIGNKDDDCQHHQEPGDFQLIVPESPMMGVTTSPYSIDLMGSLKPSTPESAEEDNYLSTYKQLRSTICNLIGHSETLFPGEFDSRWASELETVVLPSLEKRPLSSGVDDISPLVLGRNTVEQKMLVIDLFTPNALLLCRLDQIIDQIVREISDRLLHD